MRKQIFLLCFFFIIAFIPNFAIGKQGQAMLKIVKSDDGTVEILDTQVNDDAKALVLNPGPDLICNISTIGYNEPNLIIDSWVKNIGTESSGYCDLAYFLSKDSFIGEDTFLLSEPVNPLIPGKHQSFSRTLNVSSRPGIWYVYIFVDGSYAVAEDDEFNNLFFPFNFVFLVSGPNLTVNNASWSYSITRQLDIQVKVINSGTVSAGSSVLGFYLSEDANISTGDIKLGDLPVFSFPPGAQSAKSFVVSDVGNYAPSGSYFVGVVVDETNAVAELDETDNTWTDEIPLVFSTAVEEPKRVSTPTAFKLEQNYPNPFNLETIISYTIPSISRVRLIIFDVLGKEVVSLVDEVKQPGVYYAIFNSDHYSNGLYYYSLEAGGHVIIRKMMLLK
jgi:hypothetical protein